MKRRRFAFILFLAIGLVLLFSVNSHAYWEELGINIPLSGKDLYSMFVKDPLEEVVTQVEEELGYDLSSINNGEVSGESDEFSDNQEGDDESNHSTFNFKEGFISSIVDNNENTSIKDRYSLSDIKVELNEDGMTAKLYLDNGAAVEGKFEYTEEGELELIDLKNIGDKDLTKVELIVIEKIAETVPEKILDVLPDNSTDIERIEINAEEGGFCVY